MPLEENLRYLFLLEFAQFSSKMAARHQSTHHRHHQYQRHHQRLSVGSVGGGSGYRAGDRGFKHPGWTNTQGLQCS